MRAQANDIPRPAELLRQDVGGVLGGGVDRPRARRGARGQVAGVGVQLQAGAGPDEPAAPGGRQAPHEVGRGAQAGQVLRRRAGTAPGAVHQARCTHASGRASPIRASTSPGRVRSAVTAVTRPPGSAGCDGSAARRTTASTRSPRAARARATCDPINPRAPSAGPACPTPRLIPGSPAPPTRPRPRRPPRAVARGRPRDKDTPANRPRRRPCRRASPGARRDHQDNAES